MISSQNLSGSNGSLDALIETAPSIVVDNAQVNRLVKDDGKNLVEQELYLQPKSFGESFTFHEVPVIPLEFIGYCIKKAKEIALQAHFNEDSTMLEYGSLHKALSQIEFAKRVDKYHQLGEPEGTFVQAETQVYLNQAVAALSRGNLKSSNRQSEITPSRALQRAASYMKAAQSLDPTLDVLQEMDDALKKINEPRKANLRCYTQSNPINYSI